MAEMRRAFADLIDRFVHDEGAATAIEYALLATGIAIAIFASVFTLRDTLMTNYYNKLSPSVFNQ